MIKKTIFHIDVNSAFLSWEAAYRIHHLGGSLDLRLIPSAIGGSTEMRHGIILAKSTLAKKYGITTGMTTVEAMQKCPGLYLAPPNYSLYQRCSKAFLSILREYTPDVEVYSIDEAFLDMTGVMHLYRNAVDVADEIRERIREELGFTVNVGISENKLLAKMAGELRKPDYTHTLFSEEIPEKLWPLPVRELFFCGRASEEKLKKLGIDTIGQLANASPDLLRMHMKSQGQILWGYANGIDTSEVIKQPPKQKGYGNSTTAPYDICDMDTARMILLALAETVGTRLRKDKVKAGVLSVSICTSGLKRMGHQRVLRDETNITVELYRESCRLLEELWDGKTSIRQFGIHTSRLCDAASFRQLDFFADFDYVKYENLDKTVDTIRGRYGMDSVKRAVFLCQSGIRPIDHMEGGISREKRTVDYTKLNVI